MAHVLNKLTGVKIEDIKQQLTEDAPEHAKHGLYLEHIWKNSDNADEIFFLFRVEDINAHKALMKQVHEQARQENPEATLPQKIFLEEV